MENPTEQIIENQNVVVTDNSLNYQQQTMLEEIANSLPNGRQEAFMELMNNMVERLSYLEERVSSKGSRSNNSTIVATDKHEPVPEDLQGAVRLEYYRQLFQDYANGLNDRLQSEEEKPKSKEESVRSQVTPKPNTQQVPSFTEYVGPLKMPSRSSDEDENEIIKTLQHVHRRSNSKASKKPKAKKPPTPSGSSGSSSSDSDSDSDEKLESSSSSSDSYTSRKKKSSKNKLSRRSSILDNMSIAPRNTVVTMQQQPKFDHITLENITLKEIFSFMDKVYEYQHRNGVSIPVASLISERVRRQLIAHHLRTSSLEDFFRLSTEKIFKYLLKEVKPRSKLAFLDCLDKHLKFEVPYNYVPSASNFKPLYNGLLLYRKDFERIYEVISTKNKDNIPDLKNKDGGLLKVFLDKIPFDYGQRLFKSFKNDKFHSIQMFLDYFYSEVENDYKRYKLVKETNSHFKSADFVQKDIKLEKFPSAEKKAFPYRKPVNKVSALSQDIHEVVKDSVETIEINNDISSSDHDSEQNDKDDNGIDLPNDVSDQEYIDESIQDLAYVNSSTKVNEGKIKSDVPNGCFKMLFFGSCPKLEAGNKCSYSHDTQVLVRSHSYYSKLLAQSKYKPGNIVRKPPANVSAISFVSGEMVNISDTLAMSEYMKTEFLNAMPEAALFSASHREGIIELSDLTIPVDKVLFDTGALHANYISSSFVQGRKELSEYVRPCSAVVKLADNKTTARIDHMISLPVLFIDDNEGEHRATIDFCIFDTSGNDMIIGLPSIIKDFHILFKSMIDIAVDACINVSNPSATSTLNHLTSPWTKPIEEEAPEDIATELPSSFPYALHFMEMSPEEALEEYKSLIPKHVDETFRKHTKIEDLLITKGCKVFVPQNWDGINGVEPLVLKWRDGMPETIRPRARPVNPRLYQHALKEFDRLLKYFYVPSDSPIASCLVIAPKATAPFIRFCGDYVTINKYIVTGHYPIPNVRLTLEKISKFKIFLDFDMVNSFHQIKLAQETSEKLSVQTPWMLVRPLFLPEGVPIASGVLQKIVSEIFGDFEEWSIAIFDNLLVLANDYDDAYRKVEIILDRCIERNVFLKFSKTWLGFDHAKFFGYICKYGCYELSQDRKDAIMAVEFPKNTKQMQSFLGAALFFKDFIPHYSTLVAPLNDMIKLSFNWDDSTWSEDYRKIFEQVKSGLQEATAVFYPDYNLEWILRTDASQYGVGAVLLQVFLVDNNPQYQPLGFASQKFSSQASRWSTIEQEAYGIYFGVKSFAYYLLCKPFILETDHNNLLWIEASAVPKVIRWRVYLQSFSFMLRHIAGKKNLVADWLSRASAEIDSPLISTLDIILYHMSHQHLSDIESAIEQLDPNHHSLSPKDILTQVHGGRMGHFGVRKTWKMLNEFFPGHRIPYRVVDEFVATCPICQKDRLGMVDNVQPLILTLKPEQRRSMVGIDTLTVTPPDELGNTYILVIVNHFTKFTALYPAKDHNALTTATSLFQYFCTFGLVDCIITDPGSEFMNEVIAQLTTWFGIRHRFSLVDRHESNGVEHTNAMILRHLKALIFDERVQYKWSSPTVLPLIQFMLNSFDNSETGVVPFHAHFGSADATYFQLPPLVDGKEKDSMPTQHYVKLLDENLRLLHDISKDHQAAIAKERQINSSPELQNIYQPGDFVLWQRDVNMPLPTKLSPKFVGPYEVISQVKNDVSCRHVILGHVKVFHVSRLKIFHGSLEDAKKVAMIDNNQYVIREFKAYRGDPLLRTTVEFEILFEDDSLVWLPWSKDLFETVQYETYCRSRPELYPLIFDFKTAQQRIRDINKSPITLVQPGDIRLVDLRCYGHGWYQSLQLEDKDHINYLLEYQYIKWKSRQHLKIEVLCPIFNEVFVVDHYFVFSYGSWTEDDWLNRGLKYKIVDEALIRKYPELLPNKSK